MKKENGHTPKRPSFRKIIQAILAGAFGVQSSRAATQDFESQSPWHYLVAAIIFTLLFIVTIVIIVKIVLQP